MDRDLLALQEVRDLIGQARGAQAQLAKLNQEQVDRICAAMAQAGSAAAGELARLAVEETGMGNIPHKTIKNLFNTIDLWDAIRDLKTVGVIAR
ncbi:MAG: recombinase, partial [Rhodoferax sp.]|nr:recombinase [Rhodoferax sp.]